MTERNLEVLLHPVRIKILTALEGREATPQEIAAAVPDVPKASLYRHLNILRACGAIREVREYRVRGTFEKVYALETETGPLAILSPNGAPGRGSLREWLGGLVRPESMAAPLSDETLWSRTAVLTSAEADALRKVVSDWLDARPTRSASENSAAIRVDVRITRATADSHPPAKEGDTP